MWEFTEDSVMRLRMNSRGVRPRRGRAEMQRGEGKLKTLYRSRKTRTMVLSSQDSGKDLWERKRRDGIVYHAVFFPCKGCFS